MPSEGHPWLVRALLESAVIFISFSISPYAYSLYTVLCARRTFLMEICTVPLDGLRATEHQDWNEESLAHGDLQFLA